ncbi:MAG: MoaD/ThiS family protein [Phycisphaerae bacterium]
MNVTVEYSAQLSTAIGVAEESVETGPGCTPAGLIGLLAERHGDAFRMLVLDDTGRVLPWIVLTVGDRTVEFDSPRTLEDGQRFGIIIPISGG